MVCASDGGDGNDGGDGGDGYGMVVDFEVSGSGKLFVCNLIGQTTQHFVGVSPFNAKAFETALSAVCTTFTTITITIILLTVFFDSWRLWRKKRELACTCRS